MRKHADAMTGLTELRSEGYGTLGLSGTAHAFTYACASQCAEGLRSACHIFLCLLLLCAAFTGVCNNNLTFEPADRVLKPNLRK